MNNDDYLPKKVAIRLTRVGERQLRNYVAEGRLDRRYYIKGGQYDLVCYRAQDVLNVAQEKGYSTELFPEDVERIILYENTFPNKVESKNLITTTPTPTPNQAIEKMQNEVLLTQIITPLTAICDTLIRIEEKMKSGQKPKRDKMQSYATIFCVFLWSCLMVYGAIAFV